MSNCKNPGCPCVCDDPDMHHDLARLGGGTEVDPSCCARAESADLRSRLERAESEARVLREVHISPTEVRRAVEEEAERIVRLLRVQASRWEPDTPVRHALEVAASAIRARGKG